MTQSARFWDRIADLYAKKPIDDEAAYQKKLEVTRKYLRPDMEVLEFGCGTGSTALEHAPHVKHVLAADISSRMIEIAQDKADAAHVDNVTFVKSTIEEFREDEERYDVALGLSILHLLEDKEAVIAKVYRMLKSGGVFVTSTVCMGDTMSWFRFIVPIGRFLGLMPMVKVFSSDGLVRSLTDAGFAIDYQWQPAGGKAVFIVAKKPA